MVRRVAIVVGAIAVIMLAAGIVALMTVYAPLVQGSSAGADASFPDSAWVRLDDDADADADPPADRSLFVYCTTTPRESAWMVSLRNDGPLPLTILGLDPPAQAGEPYPPSDDADFVFRDLARFRADEPGDLPELARESTDPRTAPTLAPTELAPGAETEVWVRFWVPSLDTGISYLIGILPVRVRVLGLERTLEVDLPTAALVIEGAPCRTE